MAQDEFIEIVVSVSRLLAGDQPETHQFAPQHATTRQNAHHSTSDNLSHDLRGFQRNCKFSLWHLNQSLWIMLKETSKIVFILCKTRDTIKLLTTLNILDEFTLL